MKFSWRRLISLGVLLSVMMCTLTVGCHTKTEEEVGSKGDGPLKDKPREEEHLEPLPGEPTVEMWDWERIQNAPKEHPGKVVVLHVWATWNESLDSPDVADKAEKEKKVERLKKVGFDEFVRLKKLLRDDVVALSLNTDYNSEIADPASLKGKVTAFLKDRGANFENGISTVPDEELNFLKLEIFYTPATLVYDKSGKLRKKFTYNEEKDKWYSYRQDVIPLVKTLIAEKVEPPKSPAPKEKPNAEETPPQSDENAAKAEANATEKVSVELDNWDGLQKRVTDAKGRVVVVDLWSTQCVPCLKEFPNLVNLHNERKDDVACLSFNLDFYGVGEPEELKPEVLTVLKKLDSTLPNVMSNVADETVYENLKLASIPAVYVYDREGKLRKRFDDTQGQFTYEKDILPLVETLIKEKK